MSEHVAAILAANAPLVIALFWGYWWLTPKVIKATLQNGGGEVIRKIVKAENAAQSVDTSEHLGKIRERMVAVETRLKDHLEACKPPRRGAR